MFRSCPIEKDESGVGIALSAVIGWRFDGHYKPVALERLIPEKVEEIREEIERKAKLPPRDQKLAPSMPGRRQLLVRFRQ
jgi:hypothetical protein